ncbi:MAG: UDP-N-acetylmuramate dehydrogenase [Candidatus Zixiibacteriota bacterium]
MVEQLSVSPDVPRPALVAALGSRLEFDKELAPFTSFKTGGPAKYFYSAQTVDDIVRAVKAAREYSLPYFILGGGSNVLVSDQGFDGLIVKVDVTGISLIGETEVECGAGEELMSLVNFCAENSLTGLEFASGIWGTVGGAIYGNAGAYGGEIGSVLAEVVVVDRNGNIKTVDRAYCRFGYRDSYLKTTGEVVVKARFRFKKGDKQQVRQQVAKILSLRRSKHPADGMSAGCFFKNIPDPNQEHGKIPAGCLLEQVGAKQLAVGGAKVFEGHANIIVNTGTATSQDIRRLADLLKRKVLERFGIELQEEVIPLGKF